MVKEDCKHFMMKKELDSSQDTQNCCVDGDAEFVEG